MHRFRNILLYVSGEKALPAKVDAAVDLAERNDAALTIVDVVSRLEPRWRALPSVRGEVDLEETLVDARRSALEEIAAGIDRPTRVEVLRGTAHVELIRTVIEHGYDLIVAAPDEPDRASLIGASAVQHLLRKSPVPVWVHMRGTEGASGVAVAVGPLTDEREDTGLDTKLLTMASTLAHQRNERLHVIHAWRLPGETMMRGSRSPLTPTEVSDLLDRTKAEATAAIGRLVDAAIPVDVGVVPHIRKGEPADVIARVVSEIRPSTLVMGTVARGGISGLIVGNTAEKVFGRLETSLLAVKPEGFVTPVGWD